ncbi:MAG: hypothetical protein SGARI_002944 [Bacillariaceae sp.]
MSMDDDASGGMDFPGSATTNDTLSDSFDKTDAGGGFQETTFTDDGTSFSSSNEPTFSDDTSFSTNDDFGQQSSDFGSDTEMFDTGGAEEAAEEAGSAVSSIFSTLWDIFTGDD